jgi:spore coat protein H
MTKIFRILSSAIMAVFLVIASLISLGGPDALDSASTKEVQKKLNQLDPGGVVVASNSSVTKVLTDIDNLPLEDNPEIYRDDDPGSVVTMYLTVRRGNDRENTNHSWEEVNDTLLLVENAAPVTLPKAEVILQVGNENGPLAGELGYDARVSNGAIQVRASLPSQGAQKSYKIELFDSAGTWRGQKTISLNKHINDVTRVRNKLAFDLLKTLPNMVSLRTQFVHLYVKDETASSPSQAFEDYGLFTQIEQPNNTFLRNHLLDRYGQLYKPVLFEFLRYPDNLRPGDDPLYDAARFQEVLEIKGSQDHTKLIAMLEDVNNRDIPIEQTIAKHFDEENYFTWMAFNVLVGNVDTRDQNFYLYSPQNGQKWYFLPWDYDGAFMRWEREQVGAPFSPWEQGIANYWGVALHRRVLEVPAYREKLDLKIREVRQRITPEAIQGLLDAYRPVTEAYVGRMPDLVNLPGTIEDFDLAYDSIPGELDLNYSRYLETLESPLPFSLGTPEEAGDSFLFTWEEARDFDAEDITYRFELSRNWDFAVILAETSLVNANRVAIPQLEPGVYFWRVIAANASGKSQVPTDFYIDSLGMRHDGLKYLYVSPRGEIFEKQEESR